MFTVLKVLDEPDTEDSAARYQHPAGTVPGRANATAIAIDGVDPTA